MSRLGTVQAVTSVGVRRLVFWLYVAAASVLLLSPLPFDVDRVGPAGQLVAVAGVRMSTLGHLTLYTVGAALAVWPTAGWSARVAVLFVHGPATECLQILVPQRTAELSDVLADWAGALVGVALMQLLWRARRSCAATVPQGAAGGPAGVASTARASADAICTS